MHRLLLLSLPALLCLQPAALAAPQAAAGQTGGHCVAAMVNDVPVTAFELTQHVRLALMSSRVPDTPDNRDKVARQVLRRVIDERLLLNDAKRSGIRIDQREIEERVQRIEQDNGMPPGGVKAFLGNAGIPYTVFSDQISAGIAWSKIVRRKAGPGLEVSEAEVDEAMRQMRANAGKSENRVAEIFLPVDRPDQADEAQRTARRIVEQLRAGAPFAAMVQQFSRGGVAARAGDLGWLLPGTLDPALDAAISRMAVNQVSDPIRTPAGWHILKLLAQRPYGRGNPGGIRLDMLQLLLPLPHNSTPDEIERQKGLAQTVMNQAKSCADLRRVCGRTKGCTAADSEGLSVGNLPPTIAEPARTAAVGQPLGPYHVGNAIQIVAVCTREGDGGLPSRDAVRESLFAPKLEAAARRYMRDLRRNAIIDIRNNCRI